jgi:hypothetical protein
MEAWNVNEPKDRRWRELCQAIIDEPDPAKLHDLAKLLNDELKAREDNTQQRIDAHFAAFGHKKDSPPEST